MIPYQHDLAFERLIHTGPSMQRTLLRIYTGDDISEVDARQIWQRITDHKWYVSEQLGRDVGFHVAAIDYVENFYRANSSRLPRAKTKSLVRKLWLGFNKALVSYFTAKGEMIPH